MNLDIQFDRLSVIYGDLEAVRNVSFHLPAGKVYGLLGRNGAGKTSLLSVLASFREPSSGSVTIGGEQPFENAKIMREVSFIYDVDYKDETDKVKAAIESVARYRPHFDTAYALELARKFNLPLDKQLKQLSKGMQSAFNVCIGLASRSPVTILDEVYLGMDAPSREIFYRELLEDQERHPRTFILSTHLVSEMDYLFEEVIIIHKGQFVLQDDYESLTSRGVSVTGPAAKVDEFIQGMKVLNVQQLGSTKAVMVYGELSEEAQLAAHRAGLEIGPISLQDLFIHLTGEEYSA
ncbi:ABC transporter [Paenibacillus sp. LC231]|uniref:ATP-binding cassette domain-containing protein n=1 Tax=unclassified Paenibacillus TaxID=185978 RepID=UPI0008DC7AD7|nr:MULTISPECIES: ABC transporter ATP-binding protein [unclassified Paenibacillus]MCT1400140.1 ABC transporter ATP-binding protein [Paenibacillus sp. p3-SID867]OIA99260.1 ABC transporter [Paenibacillus sp. LC231]